MQHIDQLRDWQRRAQKIADEATHSGTKKAVRETEMAEAERKAAGHLFSEMEDVILPICEHAYRKADETAGPTPRVELEDVLQESYELFLRALVRFDPDKGDLETYLLHALRRRVEVYLRSKSEHVDDRREDDRPPVKNSDRFRGHSNHSGKGPDIDILAGFDVVGIVDEMVKRGQLPGDQDEIEEMWDEIQGT